MMAIIKNKETSKELIAYHTLDRDGELYFLIYDNKKGWNLVEAKHYTPRYIIDSKYLQIIKQWEYLGYNADMMDSCLNTFKHLIKMHLKEQENVD